MVRQAKTADPTLTEALGSLLEARDHRYRAFLDIEKRVRTIAHEDPICQLLMSATGAGVVAALTLKATVDNPKRFRRSKTVVVHFALMPQKVSVGRAGQSWHILEAGDVEVPSALLVTGLVCIWRASKRSAPILTRCTCFMTWSCDRSF